MKERGIMLQYHLDIVLTKMFEMVNLDYKTMWHDYKVDPYWFKRNEWTKEQLEEYVEWLAQYFISSSDARRSIMGTFSKNKKRCFAAASLFANRYGWRIKDESKINL